MLLSEKLFFFNSCMLPLMLELLLLYGLKSQLIMRDHCKRSSFFVLFVEFFQFKTPNLFFRQQKIEFPHRDFSYSDIKSIISFFVSIHPITKYCVVFLGLKSLGLFKSEVYWVSYFFCKKIIVQLKHSIGSKEFEI